MARRKAKGEGGGGGGNIGGSISQDQIAYGSGLNTITGDNRHTIDSAGRTNLSMAFSGSLLGSLFVNDNIFGFGLEGSGHSYEDSMTGERAYSITTDNGVPTPTFDVGYLNPSTNIINNVYGDSSGINFQSADNNASIAGKFGATPNGNAYFGAYDLLNGYEISSTADLPHIRMDTRVTDGTTTSLFRQTHTRLDYVVDGNQFLAINSATGVYQYGDVDTSLHGNRTVWNDAGETIDTYVSGSFNIRDTTDGFKWFLVDAPNQFTQMGDIDQAYAGNSFYVDGANNLFGFDKSGTTLFLRWDTAPSAPSMYFGQGVINTASSGNGANVGIGYQAGNGITTAEGNTWIGYGAGTGLTTGQANSFFGANAGSGISTESGNLFFGNNSGMNSTASSNTFVGAYSGQNSANGTQNAYFGNNSGLDSQGNYNTFLGTFSGDSQTAGDYNIFIGHQANGTDPTASGQLNIGGIIWGADIHNNPTAVLDLGLREGSGVSKLGDVLANGNETLLKVDDDAKRISFSQTQGDYTTTYADYIPQVRVVNVSSPEILDYGATPVEIIPAPGVGKTVKILDAKAFYNYNGIAYTNIDVPSLQYQNGIGSTTYWQFPTNMLSATVDLYVQGQGVSYYGSTTSFDNSGIYLSSDAASSPMTGNGTLDIEVTYIITDTLLP